GPAAAWWLRDRMQGKFPVHTHSSVVDAAMTDDGKVRLRVRADAAGERVLTVDRVIAATGYEVDVDRVAFLSRELKAAISRYDRAPRLSRRFESSVPGLYFVGPAAAASFGPLVRFVAGSYFAVPAVAGALARRP